MSRVQSQLVPWWLMIRFPAHFFFRIVQEMEYAQRLRNQHDSILTRWYANRILKKKLVEIKKDFAASFAELLLTTHDLGLHSSAEQTKRVLQMIVAPDPDLGVLEYAETMQALLDRLYDDTKRRQFFMIPSHRVAAYADASHFFGEEVNTAFPLAQSDIEHAAKCYAFGRNTATVFHLMRVMEIGLRSLGESLDDQTLDARRNPNWDTILKRCDDQLKLPLKERSPRWQSNDPFYSNALANLRAVKNAWRNPTMHVERDYDEDEALDVLNSVKGFMRILAGKLK